MKEKRGLCEPSDRTGMVRHNETLSTMFSPFHIVGVVGLSPPTYINYWTARALMSWNAARDSDVLSTLLCSKFRLQIKIGPNHYNMGA